MALRIPSGVNRSRSSPTESHACAALTGCSLDKRLCRFTDWLTSHLRSQICYFPTIFVFSLTASRVHDVLRSTNLGIGRLVPPSYLSSDQPPAHRFGYPKTQGIKYLKAGNKKTLFIHHQKTRIPLGNKHLMSEK